jgi:S-adenosylmethionine:tRNA ribosyltransferase-isomerase
MRVDAFDFELPSERIALRPAEPREIAQLLVVDPLTTALLADHHLGDLPSLLRPGDCLVVNNTKVLPARLQGTRNRDGAVATIEVTLHKREDGQSWLAFVRPAKKLKINETVVFKPTNNQKSDRPIINLEAVVADKYDAGEVLLRFTRTGEDLDAAIRSVGVMPLPPYIAAKRPEDEQDDKDYQTVFAARTGAVAAPTAGLHFTPALLGKLANAGINRAEVTLHVGAGTFLPVKVDDTDDHKMHAEWGEITPKAARLLNETRARGGRIVAVGTTSLRLLESAAQEDGSFSGWSGDTAIFITPGYRFKAVDVLLTNFHLPKSTLFMLVSAFSGLDTMRKAYKHAIQSGYRFYSYGDACLLHRSN